MDYDTAYGKVQQLKKFYKNLVWFGIVTAIIIGNNWLDNGFHHRFFGGRLLLAIWAIILIIKAFSLFVLDDKWEKEILEKELKKTKESVDF
ncbi:2TM domain-containing protein [Chryseobacterium gallinarum]|uniref:2TM domain-containing protein n=1 Tax=Chryseobacterium gallinarum TaxID=1324352 RepID=UPI002023F643|nr:2TM domain-containing protein [Chryseobacterium gallinarum]MCL8536154.1 2TM domain-containing protein [Chryseobacterium gallinarum]